MADDLLARLTAEGPFFKLIGGANFVDLEALTTLVEVYAAAGARLVDVAATTGAVDAALEGIRRAGRADGWPLVMVSVTTGDDPHGQVAAKDEGRCTGVCPHCFDACPHNAIAPSPPFDVVVDRCCGCDLCIVACPHDALALVPNPLGEPLEACWETGARALELHTGTGDPAALASWEGPCKAWIARGGLLAVSVNAVQLPLDRAVEVANQVVGWHPEARVIVQTDGKPISGTSGEASTLPAVRMAAAFLGRVPGGAAIQPAGGANDHTGPVARRERVPIAGVGVGSFARRLVEGAPRDLALDRARGLVASVTGRH